MSNNTEKNKCKLVIMFTLNFGFFLVELIVGYLTHSMALVADSFHMLSDVAALVVAYFAVRMSPKKWSKNTYGWARAEVLGALVNSVFLIALCFSIVIESIKRFFNPEDLENPVLILIVGAIGLVMNLAGLCIFRGEHGHGHGHSHGGGHHHSEPRRSSLTHSNRLTRMVQANAPGDEVMSEDDEQSKVSSKKSSASNHPTSQRKNSTNSSTTRFHGKSKDHKPGAAQMNIQGVFLHLLADALGSVIVLIAALVVWLTDWEYKHYVDPSLSLIAVCLIMISVYPLLVESSLILLQSVPGHINVNEIERKLLKHVDGVIGIHELHVWQLAGDRIVATAHIKCRTIEEYAQIAEKVKALFHNEGIHSTTIQPEFSSYNSTTNTNDKECTLSCEALSTSCTDCAARTCCPKNEPNNSATGRAQVAPAASLP